VIAMGYRRMYSSKLNRAVAGLAAAGAFAGAAASAQANIHFPSPGAMSVAGLPAQIRAGHMWNLRELMPLAIPKGEMLLERQVAPGQWATIVKGKIRPRVLWLHWRPPRALVGSLDVRFVLESGGKLLAVSPTYTMAVRARGSH